MSFSYSLSTDLGKVRLAIGDTVSGSGPRFNGGNFSDEEIAVFLTPVIAAGYTYGRAVASLFRLLAGEWAGKANISIGEYSIQYGNVADGYLKAAAMWDASTDATGALTSGITTGVMTLANSVYSLTDTGLV